MKRPELPDLASTGRHYVEDTARVRLASPGIERFEARRGRTAGSVLAAVLVLAVLVGAMIWLSR